MIPSETHPTGLRTEVGRNVASRQTGFGLQTLGSYFVQLAMRERIFLALVALGFFAAGLVYPYPNMARWMGFGVAAYAAVSNDSIQTIGTFIASNGKRPWWLLWIFIGGIFLVTVTYSFIAYDGDVSYQRLAAKGFETTPAQFTYLQVAAPIFLLVMTRFRMPVSTTFLLLSSFASTSDSIVKVLEKSLAGYVVAFVLAFGIWIVLSRAMERWFSGEPRKIWMPLQWLTSGALWSVWIMQDAANTAVYLPRKLSALEFVAFAGVIVLGLGWLFRLKGDRIQSVVEEKSRVVDVRAATIIDLVYACILYYFKAVSPVPMSTTWVFIGLLGGRELAMAIRGTASGTWRHALRVLTKDIALVTAGLVISLIIAASVNAGTRDEWIALLGF